MLMQIKTTQFTQRIVAILILAVMGQLSVFANVPCQNMMSKSAANPVMTTADKAFESAGHRGMHHSDTMPMMAHADMQHHGEHSDSSASDSSCCASCDCSLGSCLSVVLPTPELTFAAQGYAVFEPYSPPLDDQPSFSHFRPPISH